MLRNCFEKFRKVHEKTHVPEFLAGLDGQLYQKETPRSEETTDQLRFKLQRYNLVILISITQLLVCERKPGFSNSTSFL